MSRAVTPNGMCFTSSRVELYPITSFTPDAFRDDDKDEKEDGTKTNASCSSLSVRKELPAVRLASFECLRTQKAFVNLSDLSAVFTAMKATIQTRIASDGFYKTETAEEKSEIERAVLMHAVDLWTSLMLDSSSRWNGVQSLAAMAYVCVVLAYDQISDCGSLKAWFDFARHHPLRPPFHLFSKKDVVRMYSQVCVHLDWNFRSEMWRLLQLLTLQSTPDYGPAGSFLSDLALIPETHVIRNLIRDSTSGKWLLKNPELTIRACDSEWDVDVHEHLRKAWWSKFKKWNDGDEIRKKLEKLVLYCMEYAAVHPRGHQNSLVFLCSSRVEKLGILLQLVALRCTKIAEPTPHAKQDQKRE
jgi:hypothetical protein